MTFGPGGGASAAWYAPFNNGETDLLLPSANPGEVLIPPFPGANGIEFDGEGTILYAMNTAYHSIVAIPVNLDGASAGAAATLTTGINAPDGVAVDRNDNLWVVANQESDEIVVVNPQGKAIAKKGDFDGVTGDGSIDGLLFPASDAFSPDGHTLYVTNLALNLPFAGVPEIAVDSAWTLKVEALQHRQDHARRRQMQRREPRPRRRSADRGLTARASPARCARAQAGPLEAGGAEEPPGRRGSRWSPPGRAPTAPASPQPFTPSGLVVQRVPLKPRSKGTRSSARGSA